ncbi:MAG TPA: glycoside hydrolase family 3 N-terminal domain-containing protein, partial [Nitrospirota bacterium]
IIASDMERGAGQQLAGGTVFPCQMAVAAATSLVSGEGAGLVKEMADSLAFEARAAGVNAVFTPVLDVNSNPDNPIICTRAFSDEPQKVSALGELYIAGLQTGKTPVMACAKHYPGHGDAALDSHSALPRIDKDKESLEDEDMLPFRKAVMAGVEMVMAGHLLVPAIDPSYPASLSKKVIKDFLRTRSGFEGLVVTDALDMGAVAGAYSPREAARLAIKAGADILLHPASPADYLRELFALSDEKGVTKEEVMSCAGKMQRAKAKYAVPVKLTDAAVHERMSQDRELAQTIAERALTLVKADGAFPALQDIKGNILHVVVDDDGNRMAGRVIRSVLKARNKKIKNLVISNETVGRLKGEAMKAARSSQITLVSIFSRVSAGKGRSGLSPELSEFCAQLVAKTRKTVVVSFGSPYILRGLMGASYVVAAYDPGEAMQMAACRAFSGEIFFGGELPVRI